VVIEKRHEEPSRLAVTAQDLALHLLASAIHVDDPGRRGETLGECGQRKKERKIERRVDTHEVSGVASVSPDELRNAFLAVEHLSIREEVLLADAQGVFPHRVAEGLGKVPLDEFQRIDAESIDVVARDRMLIRKDQGVSHRKHRAVGDVGDELLERLEVAAGLGPLASAPKKGVALQLGWPDEPVRFAIRGGDRLDDGKIGSCATGLVPPLDGLDRRAPWSGTAHARVSEDVAGVVEHDVEDHVQAQRVRRVDESPQLLVLLAGRGRKSRLGLEEILDAVAVEAPAIGLPVLEDG
jgi:hypothetical protein